MHHPHHQTSPAAPLFGLIVIVAVVGVLLYVAKGNVTVPTNSLAQGSDKTSSTSTILRVITQSKNAGDKSFLVDATNASSTEESHEASWRYQQIPLTIEQPSVSSSASLVVGNGWRVTLRSKDGMALQDPQVVGMKSDKEAYVVAHTRYSSVYLVKREGDIREMTRLSETQRVIATDTDGVWILDQVPSEGIEQAPTGPSSLWFASLTDIAQPLVTSSEEIVDVVGNPNTFAWVSRDVMHFHTKSIDMALPNARPVTWIGGTLFYWKRVGGNGSDLYTWNEANVSRNIWSAYGIPTHIELLSGPQL